MLKISDKIRIGVIYMNETKNNRNINIDLVRGIAILVILIYHIYCVTKIGFKYEIINSIISMGGELGVTIFFILSGYGIYKLLNKNMTYKEYLVGRLKKLLPHYYISLFLIIVLTPAAIYLSIDGIINIVSHGFLFHNLFYNTHGSISGVCWTMGVIFQFYLIAPFLKKILDKRPLCTIIGSILISFIIKYILFIYIFPSNNADSMYYFIYGRQLFTSIESFIFGMLISKYEKCSIKKNYLWILLTLIMLLLNIIFILYGSNYGLTNPIQIYSSNIKGVIYSIVFSALLFGLIYSFSQIKLNATFIDKYLLFIAKHEYSIYIWHLLIITNLYSNCKKIADIFALSPILGYILFSIIVIALCVLIDVIVSSINIDDVCKKIKHYSKSVFRLVVIAFVLYVTYRIYPLINEITDNFNNSTLNSCDAICEIEKKYYEKTNCKDRVCKYLLIDNLSDGFLNYYKLRYKLSPNIPYDFNNNNYVINNGTDSEFYNYIINLDCDYVIIMSSERLERLGYETKEIYIINKKSQDIDNLLMEVE